MRFSIVILVYNVAALLPACLDSLKSQVDGVAQIVLVDDGSTDGSGDICDAFANEVPETIVIHQENKGLFAARGAGMRVASGDYIVSVDSDDRIRADALRCLSDAIDEWDSPDVIAYRFSREETFGPARESALPMSPGPYCSHKGAELRALVCDGRHNSLWSKAFKRGLLEAAEIPAVPWRLTHGEDLLRLCCIADAAYSFAYLDEALYYYRPNPSSSTASYSPAQLKDLSFVLSEFLRRAAGWEEGLSSRACAGATLQCCYLLQILFESPMDACERRRGFNEIAAFMRNGSLLSGRWTDGLRLDKRLEVACVKYGWASLARLLVQIAHFVRKMRD